MEINLYELWIYSKHKLIYFTVIAIFIYFICIYSNNLFSRFKVLNNIKIKIKELEKLKEYENIYIKNKGTQVNDISSSVLYQQNINNSLQNEFNKVNEHCNYTDKNYINNLNSLSMNVPSSIKNKLRAYISNIEEQSRLRKMNDERTAQLDYEQQVKEKNRQKKLLEDAVAERNRRRQRIAREKAETLAKKEQLRKYIINSANKIPNCNQRRKYLKKIELTLYPNKSTQMVDEQYANYCVVAARPKSFFCITEDALISLPNNKFKKVKDIKIGDTILGFNNNINKISNIHKEFVNQDIIIYGINDIKPFFTDTHPIVSAININQVLSINPELTLIENPERKGKIQKLQVGDMIYINNDKIKVNKITSQTLPKNTYVYDLILENFDDYTYIANNILIESQEPKWFEYPQVTGVLGDILINNNYDEINIELINNYNCNNYSLNNIINFYELIKKYNKKKYDAFLENLYNLWKIYFNIIHK